MNSIPKNAALLLIDVQVGFDQPYWGERNNRDAESVLQRVLQVWRETNRPIFHIQHLSTDPNSPLHPDSPGVKIRPEVAPLPGETVITKSVNSAFIGTNLELQLHEAGISTLIIGGLTTQHCVSTTTRMAGNLGFSVYLLSDGTAAFEWSGNGQTFSAETIHQTELAILDREFASVVSAETVLNHLE